MNDFAAGKYAYSFCDRCGQRYDYGELKPEFLNLKRTGLRVCPECYDIDHEQLQIGRLNIEDRIALQHPRVDQAQEESRALWSWAPIGHPTTKLKSFVGTVKVVA
jgi:hypothetical protein